MTEEKVPIRVNEMNLDGINIDDINIDTSEGKKAFIEAILFVSKEPLEPGKIMSFLGIDDVSEFKKIIEQMDEAYHSSNRGIIIKRTGGGLQLATKPGLHEFLQDYFSVKSASRLTIPSLETLAIVAYRQPATLAEISDLRGVNSTGPVKNLLQKKLIKISGRKKVAGLPALYSTTKEFLLYFGLNDLSELPSLEELTEMFEEKEQPSLFSM
jgi:segregation and condensation protein B